MNISLVSDSRKYVDLLSAVEKTSKSAYYRRCENEVTYHRKSSAIYDLKRRFTTENKSIFARRLRAAGLSAGRITPSSSHYEDPQALEALMVEGRV